MYVIAHIVKVHQVEQLCCDQIYLTFSTIFHLDNFRLMIAPNQLFKNASVIADCFRLMPQYKYIVVQGS